MTNKNKAIVIAIIAGLGVVGGGLLISNNISENNKSGEIKESTQAFKDFKSDMQRDLKVLTFDTPLSNDYKNALFNKKIWEEDMKKGKTDSKTPKPELGMENVYTKNGTATGEKVFKDPKELLARLESDRLIVQNYNKKLKIINCNKVVIQNDSFTNKANCEELKPILEKYVSNYDGYINNIKNY